MHKGSNHWLSLGYLYVRDFNLKNIISAKCHLRPFKNTVKVPQKNLDFTGGVFFFEKNARFR